jgi:hypothetical protein
VKYFMQIVQKLTRITVLACLGTFLARTAYPVKAAATVFVSPSGSGAACSQAVPCNLVTGLSTAISGDTVLAAAGTYTGTGSQVVTLNKNINFYGGWSGNTIGAPTRDPATYVSILDGQNVRRVITISGGVSVQPTVDGWTIRNGNATALTTNCSAYGPAAGCGGGIHVYQASPTISNNIIEDNAAAVAGGELYAAGGGIYVQDGSGTVISRNIIRNNNSHAAGIGIGGGIYVTDSGGNLEISGNELYENEDFDSATYYNHNGGAIHINDTSGPIQVFENDIHDNNPLDEPYSGSGISIHDCDNTLVVQDNTILDNYGNWGVVEIEYAIPVIQRNTIINPGAMHGIYIFDTETIYPGQAASIYNNIVAGHEDYNIYVNAYDDHDTQVQLSHNTLADAEYGLYVGAINVDVVVTFDRGIVSGHSITGVYASPNPGITVTVTNTLFNANMADAVPGVANPSPLTGDPRFVNPSAYNYHLNRGSQAIDRVASGGLYIDIDGDTRPYGIGTTPYDVGADEYSWSDFLFLPQILRP